MATVEEPEVKLLKPSQVRPSELQPRKHFVDNVEMESSVREQGIIQPLVVRRTGGVRNGGVEFELICGERRWRAAEALGLESVPVIVREMDDRHVLEMQLSENLQRRELNPMEEALGYNRLADMIRDDVKSGPAGGMPPLYAEIARAVGKSEHHVNEYMVLCRMAGTDVAAALEDGRIKANHGRILAGVPSAKMRSELLRMLLDDGYRDLKTVKQLDNYVSQHCARDLRSASFLKLQGDPKLVPAEYDAVGERIWGGACTDCPFAVRPEGANKTSTTKLCINLECWQLKEINAHERWRREMGDGRSEIVGQMVVTLDHAENAALWKEGTQLDPSSGYVDLDESPDERELSSFAKASNDTHWSNLVEGQQIEVTLARDPRGKERLLVRHDAAKKAAHLNGHMIFRDSRNQKRMDDQPSVKTETALVRPGATEVGGQRSEVGDQKSEVRQDVAKLHKKIGKIVAVAESSFLRGHLNIPQKQFWGVLAGALLDVAAANDVLGIVAERRGKLDPESVAQLGLGERLGLVIECAIVLTGEPGPWEKMFTR